MTKEQEIVLRNALSIWFEVYDDERDADTIYHLRDIAERLSKGYRYDLHWLLNVNTKLAGKVDEKEVIAIMKEVGKKEYKRMQKLLDTYDY